MKMMRFTIAARLGTVGLALALVRLAGGDEPDAAAASKGGWIEIQFGVTRDVEIGAVAARKVAQSPRRNLHLRELEELLEAGHALLDRRLHGASLRMRAVHKLQEAAHRHAVPFLLAVAENEDEPTSLRRACVAALAAIPDPVVAERLIDLLDDGDAAIAEAVLDSLYRVTGSQPPEPPPALDPDPNSASRKALKRDWQTWWDAQRDDPKYDAWAIAEIQRLGAKIEFDETREHGRPLEVDFNYSQLVDDFDMAYVKELTSLQRIDLEETPVTDHGLAALAELRELRYLNLSRAPGVTDAGLAHLKGLTQIRVLDLRDTSVTGAGMPHLARLETLRLAYTGANDAGLAGLKALSRLTALDLNYTRITGPGLKHLRPLQGLRTLGLAGCPIDDAGLAHLPPLKGLETLSVGYWRITDEGLVHLAPLEGLKKLSLRGTRITDDGLRHLDGLVKLESLNLSDTKIAGNGWTHLKKLKNLRTVYLRRSDLGDAAMAELHRVLPKVTIVKEKVSGTVY